MVFQRKQTTMTKTCNCGLSGPVTLVFGWRNHRGEIVPQGSCKACRSKSVIDNPVKWMYKKLYPNDKNNNSRSKNFMLQRIAKKQDEPRPKPKKRTYSYILGAYTDVKRI